MTNIFDLDEPVAQDYDNISKLAPTFVFLDKLNPEQKLAVQTTEGPVLVLSGAGTGKTSVLTTRLAYILHQGLASPWNCLALTFTNRAAKEMRSRVEEMIGPAASSVWLGTFHSICVKILRRHAELVNLTSNFTILDEDDQKRVIKEILKANGVDEKKYTPQSFVEKFSYFKDKGWLPEKIILDSKGNITADIYVKYQKRLQELNAVDFGDILLKTLEIFQKHQDVLAQYLKQFKYIMVDEYQDTNVTQYLLLRLLSQGLNNICCVGDDDQSIYSWRGAEIENILRFEKDFKNATVIRLERNYRSTQNILTAASNLIAHNEDRLGKTLKSAVNSPALSYTNDKIKVIGVYSGRDESDYIAHEIENLHHTNFEYSDMAVLVRTAAQMREIEERFIERQIPYQVIGGPKFYERAEIRDVVAYLRVIAQPYDDLALERIINKPARKIGEQSVKKFKDYAYQKHIPLLKAVTEMVENGELSGQLLNSASDLVQKFLSWQKASLDISPAELTERVLEESGYMEMLKKDDSVEAEGRLENIKELIGVLDDTQTYPTLNDFLEHVSLVTETDNIVTQNNVFLMTLHSAKGLEFDAVFLPGWEDGLFPHERALNEGGHNALEEERRLAYVALTRAKQKLYILTASSRNLFGQFQNNPPSRFLNELPTPCLEIISTTAGYANNTYQQRAHTSYKQSYSYEPENTTSSQRAKNYKGMRVYHPKFGYGTLMSVDDENKCTVYFDHAGKKNIYGSYLRKA